MPETPEIPNHDLQVTPVEPVENTNPPTNDINFNMTFSEVDSPTAIKTEDEDSQINAFQHFVAKLLKKCLTMQELLIRRPHIAEDTLEYYKDETSISSKLYV